MKRNALVDAVVEAWGDGYGDPIPRRDAATIAVDAVLVALLNEPRLLLEAREPHGRQNLGSRRD